MHTIVLGDDHPLLLRGLGDLLAAESRFSVVGSATSGEDALALVQARAPTIVVLDIMMPNLGGIEVLKAMRSAHLPSKAVFLTAMISNHQIREALELGIDGMLLKESAPEEFIDCLDQVAGGGKWLPAELTARVHLQPGRRAAPSFDALTPREREIVECLCRGLSNKAIARKLGTTDGTVKVHLHNVFQKMGVTSRMSLAALAFER